MDAHAPVKTLTLKSKESESVNRAVTVTVTVTETAFKVVVIGNCTNKHAHSPRDTLNSKLAP
jgi:hypothetical protein